MARHPRWRGQQGQVLGRAVFLVCKGPHLAEKAPVLWCLFLGKGTKPVMWTPPSQFHKTPITTPKTQFPNTITLGIRALMQTHGGTCSGNNMMPDYAGPLGASLWFWFSYYLSPEGHLVWEHLHKWTHQNTNWQVIDSSTIKNSMQCFWENTRKSRNCWELNCTSWL